jgi:hypothetical protein
MLLTPTTPHLSRAPLLPQLNCTMPRNYGRQHPLVLTAGGQSSDPYMFDYDPPIIRAIVPVHDRTEDGIGARCVAHVYARMRVRGAFVCVCACCGAAPSLLNPPSCDLPFPSPTPRSPPH